MDTWVWSILLLLAAIVIVGIEMFVPSGGLLGVLSAMAVVGSIVLAYMSSFQFGMIMLIVACIMIPVVIMGALQWWPHTPLGRKIVIQPPQSDDEILPDLDEERFLKSLIGQRGIAITKMLPSGIVEIDGRQYDAFSDGMPIDDGQPVQVIAVIMRRLEVRALEPNESASNSNPSPAKYPANDDILSKPIDSLGLEPLDDPLG